MGTEKMITPNLLRAARALLDRSQGEAANGAGIALSTLSGIESNTKTPANETLAKLQVYFEGCGIEFLADGVRLQSGDMVLRGTHGMQRFFDEVYEAARHGGDICIFNGIPDLLIRWAGADFYETHAGRMAAIKDRYSLRVIVEAGEDNLIGGKFAAYRSIDPALFHDRTVYLYANKVAVFSFGEDHLAIKITADADLADSMRVLFDFAWEAAT